MLKDALIYDARGNPIRQHHKVNSRDWDEIRDWSNRVYMPYRVAPTGMAATPDSTMHSARVGRIIVTRFAYGIPVRVQDWSEDAGNAVVLTTIAADRRKSHDDAPTLISNLPGTSAHPPTPPRPWQFALLSGLRAGAAARALGTTAGAARS